MLDVRAHQRNRHHRHREHERDRCDHECRFSELELKLGFVTAEQFDAWVRPEDMTHPLADLKRLRHRSTSPALRERREAAGEGHAERANHSIPVARPSPDRAVASGATRGQLAAMSKLILVLSVMLAACSPVAVLNALAPRDGVITTSDIPYEPGPRHSLDVSCARQCRRAPVLVFIYGGGNWVRVEGKPRPLRQRRHGRPGHRDGHPGLSPVSPGQVPRLRRPARPRATAWTRANIARFGGDPHRIFLMGHSAGAQIATLLALDPEYLQAAGLAQRDICGVIGLAGPYDFLPLTEPLYQDIFGPEADWPRSQPIDYVTPQAPTGT